MRIKYKEKVEELQWRVKYLEEQLEWYKKVCDALLEPHRAKIMDDADV